MEKNEVQQSSKQQSRELILIEQEKHKKEEINNAYSAMCTRVLHAQACDQ